MGSFMNLFNTLFSMSSSAEADYGYKDAEWLDGYRHGLKVAKRMTELEFVSILHKLERVESETIEQEFAA